jgi:hypothetical protein
MKKILSLLICFTLFFAVSKAQTAFSHTVSNPTGAILNTSADTMTYSMQRGYNQVAIQPVITKASGTMAGTSVLYYSVNGTNWVATGDTLTNSNTTTNTTVWNKTSAARYWRIITSGATTVTGTTAAKLIIGNQ